ncbi:MAG: metallophosphoesterase [Thermoanaerobaculia bacterium]
MTRKSLLVFLFLLGLPVSLAAAAAPHTLTSFPPADLKPKAANADVIFVVAGDNRPTAKGAPLPRVLDAIFSEIGLIRPDFVLWTGDTVYGYCDNRDELTAEYQAFAAAAKPIAGIPLFNAPGNHEIHSDQYGCHQNDLCWSGPKASPPDCSEAVFKDHFGALYGSFDYAGAHFIALDTSVPGAEDEITGTQLRWLRSDLRRSKTARATFIFTHTEFFSSPWIDPLSGQSHPSVSPLAELEDLFVHSSVHAVFSGHEHLFWHEPTGREHNYIDYFVAGGAGAPLYATPDRGGFAHYLIVRLSGSKAVYDLIEPGHLYLDETTDRMPQEFCQDAKCAWIVGSNDLSQPLALNGVEIDVPASFGDCSGLTVAARSRSRDSWVELKNVTLDCAASVPGRVHVSVPPLGQGSVLLTVSRKSSP